MENSQYTLFSLAFSPFLLMDPIGNIPIYVALFGAWYLKERTTFKDWICIVIVFGGMSLFFFDKLTIAGVWGNIAAIFSGICFGWTALFLRKQKRAFPINSILLGNLLTAIICLPFILQSTPATKIDTPNGPFPGQKLCLI